MKIFLMPSLLTIFALASGAEGDVHIYPNYPGPPAEEKKEEPPPQEIPQPVDPSMLRSSVGIIIINNIPNIYIGGEIKIKGSGKPVSDKQVLEVNTVVEQSATVATFNNIAKAAYVYNGSNLVYLSKDAFKDNPEAPSWQPIQCILSPLMSPEAVATKNVAIVIATTEGVPSCIVTYDYDLVKPDK